MTTIADVDRYKRESTPWWVHVAGALVTIGLIVLGFGVWRQDAEFAQNRQMAEDIGELRDEIKRLRANLLYTRVELDETQESLNGHEANPE